MAERHQALFAKVLRNLGHSAPSDEDLNSALKDAFKQIKEDEGSDPDKVKYKLSLTEVDANWVEKTFRD